MSTSSLDVDTDNPGDVPSGPTTDGIVSGSSKGLSTGVVAGSSKYLATGIGGFKGESGLVGGSSRGENTSGIVSGSSKDLNTGVVGAKCTNTSGIVGSSYTEPGTGRAAGSPKDISARGLPEYLEILQARLLKCQAALMSLEYETSVADEQSSMDPVFDAIEEVQQQMQELSVCLLKSGTLYNDQMEALAAQITAFEKKFDVVTQRMPTNKSIAAIVQSALQTEPTTQQLRQRDIEYMQDEVRVLKERGPYAVE
ncbi:Hypothetical protein D9617_10g075110 [Elsinoe fawcettii]|nr:Hypothetical protein D9617_10g075110 [Elsinoe fawcettii]